jgi:hypothetical protein
LNNYLVYLSSFSYFYRSVFCGPKGYLARPALVILLLLLPFTTKLWGVAALICSITTDLGYISSITVKKPAILALWPGITLSDTTKSSL